MTRQIRLSKSVIGNEEIQAVSRVLENEYLGMGKNVQQFENELSEFFHRKAVVVNTGTAALHLALQAAGIKASDEVLVQSLTYLATFQAISASGAIPIPCEILEETFTIDLKDAEKKITTKTKAIIPVHYASFPGDLDTIYEFAEKYNLRVIEDAAHAFGTIYNKKLVGSLGDIACFSFDGIKNITSGEGGAVVTNDLSVIQRISDARLLGVQKDTEKRYIGQRSWDFDVIGQGWRFHMSNIFAAIGSAQLKRFPEFKMKRQQLAMLYQNLLQNNENVKLLRHNYNEIVPHIFVIRVKNRDFVRDELEKVGIQTGIHYKPNHLLSYFKNMGNYILPLTEKIYKEIITLPLHPDLTLQDVEFICRTLLTLVNKYE